MQGAFNDDIGIPAVVTEVYGVDTLGSNARIHPACQIRRGPSFGGRGIFVGDNVGFFGYTMLVLGYPDWFPLQHIQIGDGGEIKITPYPSGEGGLIFEDNALIGSTSSIVTAGH